MQKKNSASFDAEFFCPLTGMVRLSLARRRTAESFRPLTGMVQKFDVFVKNYMGFRPLTGMVQSLRVFTRTTPSFRPLTGMVPTSYEAKSVYELFSPPCGDGTCILCVVAAIIVVFAPLRGWYSSSVSSSRTQSVFAPLRGWYMTTAIERR